MKVFLLVMVACLMLFTLWGCSSTNNTQNTAISTPSGSPNTQPDNSGETADASLPMETAPVIAAVSYDDVFTDINDAAFTTWKSDAIEDGGNYFRNARIDVVDGNGYDHQGNVYVCYGSDDFTQAYHIYMEALKEEFGKDISPIAGFRNAAVNGYRTYSEIEEAFFCIQEVTFTDLDCVERNGVVIVLDGPEDYTQREADAYDNFFHFYWEYGMDNSTKDKKIDRNICHLICILSCE